MKKFACLILACLLLLGGCSKTDEAVSASAESPSSEAEEASVEEIEESSEESQPPQVALEEIIVQESEIATLLAPNAENVVEITKRNQLAALAMLVNSGDTTHADKTYVLMDDISLSGLDFTPIGGGADYGSRNAFLGKFDGDGHIITGLTIRDKGFAFGTGLFGSIGPGSEVKNLHLTGGNVTGHTATGGLAGHSQGTLFNCSYRGKVIAKDSDVGGLLGSQDAPEGGGAKTTQCFSNAEVSGTSSVGGFIGNTAVGAQVEDCYGLGVVIAITDEEKTTPSYIGGFIGSVNNTPVVRCYAAVEVYTNVASDGVGGFIGYNNNGPQACYYNQVATENWKGVCINYQDLSYELTGCTVEEITEQSTYVGWDFANVWEISEGKNRGLPYLRAAGL